MIPNQRTSTGGRTEQRLARYVERHDAREWSIDVVTRGRHFCNRSLSPDAVRLIERRHCQLSRASDDADFKRFPTRRAAMSRSLEPSLSEQLTDKRPRAVKRRRPEASEHEAVTGPREAVGRG